MGWWVRLGAHVLQSSRQTTTKKLIPNAVDKGAGSEWVFRSGQPVGKAQAIGGPFFFPGAQFLRSLGAHLFSRNHPIAPLEDKGWTGHVVWIFDQNRKSGASHLQQLIPRFFNCGESRLFFSFERWHEGKPNDGRGVLLRLCSRILSFNVQIDFALHRLEWDFPSYFTFGFVDHKAGKNFSSRAPFSDGHSGAVYA